MLLGEKYYIIVHCFQLSSPASQFYRCQSTLILAEHNNEKLNPVTLHAITAAKQLGGDINCLVVGAKNCSEIAQEVNFDVIVHVEIRL